jgi:hypothetical protein
VASVSVGAEHFGVGVEAVFIEVVAEGLDGDGVVVDGLARGYAVGAVALRAVDPPLPDALACVGFVGRDEACGSTQCALCWG